MGAGKKNEKEKCQERKNADIRQRFYGDCLIFCVNSLESQRHPVAKIDGELV